MAQHCVLHLSFNQKRFALVRGYLAEKIFQRGYITEKRLRTTGLDIQYACSHLLPLVLPSSPLDFDTIIELLCPS